MSNDDKLLIIENKIYEYEKQPLSVQINTYNNLKNDLTQLKSEYDKYIEIIDNNNLDNINDLNINDLNINDINNNHSLDDLIKRGNEIMDSFNNDFTINTKINYYIELKNIIKKMHNFNHNTHEISNNIIEY